MKKIVKGISLGISVLGVFQAELCLAQLAEPFAYPSQGQSAQQQQQDHFACYSWAKQQTGFDPAQPQPQTTAQSPQQGGLVRGALKGSLLGLVGGAIGGNVGEGAAIGAGVGALGGLMRRQEQQQQANQLSAQAQAKEQQNLQRYFQAWTACMTGRGYTVK
ncbi:glycine zipper family protein [Gloeothece verrucosa]|uniref:Glycine zipper domain-containing protein n=1 Tax=Gloeothece verrucosa (strain PCC 7822) TaxID=497965 RepID=E0ULE7_GLOV7|nr:glycine zipper family protein [Gloeothece verrucosa]ADN17777.1 conserved hypothetical protein; putative exported protein [Gloeothece verrucosa PCC 7822]